MGAPQSFDSLADAGATTGVRLDGEPLDHDDSLDYQGASVHYVACDGKLKNVDAVQKSVPIDHLALRIGASQDDKYVVALGGQ